MNSQTVDTRAIKNLVVNMRDSGMTYQAISEQLDKGYGIKRTRQALNRMYKRAKETELATNNGKLLACDIINIYCLTFLLLTLFLKYLASFLYYVLL